MSGQIFISYRRDDASYPAGRLYDRLLVRLPNNQIFIDVDLEPGIDFVEEIERSVGSCDVLIAVIGKRWLLSSDGEGKRRLANPDDFVRLEIATALKRNIRVIPVLVDGASMPPSGDLPGELKLLVHRTRLKLATIASDYTEAIRLNPNNALVYNNRGYIFCEKKEYDKATSDYTEAIRLKPNFDMAYRNRGNVYKSQGKFGKAKADFAKADELEKAGQ